MAGESGVSDGQDEDAAGVGKARRLFFCGLGVVGGPALADLHGMERAPRAVGNGATTRMGLVDIKRPRF